MAFAIASALTVTKSDCSKQTLEVYTLVIGHLPASVPSAVESAVPSRDAQTAESGWQAEQLQKTSVRGFNGTGRSEEDSNAEIEH